MLTGLLDLLKLWLLSGGDKKEGILEFPLKDLDILLEMGDNEVAVEDGGIWCVKCLGILVLL